MMTVYSWKSYLYSTWFVMVTCTLLFLLSACSTAVSATGLNIHRDAQLPLVEQGLSQVSPHSLQNDLEFVSTYSHYFPF